jgi:hypothetical protein
MTQNCSPIAVPVIAPLMAADRPSNLPEEFASKGFDSVSPRLLKPSKIDPAPCTASEASQILRHFSGGVSGLTESASGGGAILSRLPGALSGTGESCAFSPIEEESKSASSAKQVPREIVLPVIKERTKRSRKDQSALVPVRSVPEGPTN